MINDNSNNFLSDLSDNKTILKIQDKKLKIHNYNILQTCNDDFIDFSKNKLQTSKKN